MSKLSEEEIIDKVMMIDQWKVSGDIYTQNELNAIGELLDLYNKEKEKNKKQQKEIKELKEINKKQFLNYEKTIDNMEHKALDYISKDKIRECIQTPYPEVAIENIVELLEEELLEEE